MRWIPILALSLLAIACGGDDTTDETAPADTSETAMTPGGGATDPEAKQRFKEECEAFARRMEQEGMPAMAELYCTSSARNTYRYKDPRGWAEFKQQFADGSAKGHAMTMRGVQGSRVPFFERTEELKKIAEPMLVVIGDEDESTHGLAVHLKQHVARCGVLELPKSY